jgi:hypothetical protein
VGCVEPRSASLAAITVEFDEAPPHAGYLAQHSNSAPTRSAGGDGTCALIRCELDARSRISAPGVPCRKSNP